MLAARRDGTVAAFTCTAPPAMDGLGDPPRASFAYAYAEATVSVRLSHQTKSAVTGQSETEAEGADPRVPPDGRRRGTLYAPAGVRRRATAGSPRPDGP